MAALIQALDKHTSKQIGENGHGEYGWSHDIDEKIVQFFFQLVRNDDHTDLERQHTEILHAIKGKERQYKEQFIIMYKLIGQTRDLVNGKGEQRLAFMQLYGFYQAGYTDLAAAAFYRFLVVDEAHPYGSYKDVKYLCQYVKDKSGDNDHPLIDFATNLLLNALENDYSIYEEWKKDESQPKPTISLAGRWAPREKSKFRWVHEILSRKKFHYFLTTANNTESARKALIKCKAQFTRIIVKLNKYLDTVQCKQTAKDWANIDFNKVTSCTMRKQSRAFANKDKQGRKRSELEDRVQCASNFTAHLEAAKSDPTNHKIHGRRCTVGELTKDALNLSRCGTTETDRINLQWESNKDNNKGLGNIIACVDNSGSMEMDDGTPLYNAIGLGIRCSEMASDAFKHRVITFAGNPHWLQLNDKATFVEKARYIKQRQINAQNTDIWKMFQMILDVILKNEIPPESVEDMVLAIFSDMQIDSAVKYTNLTYGAQPNIDNYLMSLHERVEKMFTEAGMASKFQTPYPVPHILFWNLRKTSGFPVLSTKKNVSMMSGFSSTLLNVLCEKGVEELKQFTPRKMLTDLLSNERYDILDQDLIEYYCE
jgi:hypothetical protein